MKRAPFLALASINLFNSTKTQPHLANDLTRLAVGRARGRGVQLGHPVVKSAALASFT